MKTTRTIALIMLIAVICCQQQRSAGQVKQTMMTLDTIASDRTVTKVHPNDTLRPAESIVELKDLRNIMHYDLDARERIPSKDIIYVKPGEPVRPSEKAGIIRTAPTNRKGVKK